MTYKSIILSIAVNFVFGVSYSHADKIALDATSPFESNNSTLFFLNSGFMQFSNAETWEFLYGIRQKFDDSNTICRVWSSFASDKLYCYIFIFEGNKNYMYACDYTKKNGRTEMTMTRKLELKDDALVNAFLNETQIPIDFDANFKASNPAWKYLVEKTNGNYQWALRAISYTKPATMHNFDKQINQAWEISNAEREIARKSPFTPMANK